MNRARAILLSLLCAALLATSLAILAGCGQGKPQVIVFLGKSSKSYDQTKAIIDKMKKQFDDKVIWVEYDYDSPSSKSALDKYHVSMNPTILVTNTAGEVKFQALGAPREDELQGEIQSFLPQSGTKTTTPGSSPGVTTVPGSPFPPGTEQAPSTSPLQTIPGQ
jgi:hypothetical protein